MRNIVIYPGRFHPFHRGHMASYRHLTKMFGPENVFIATSGKQAPVTSPFTFADKQNMMVKLGIPSDKIFQVRNPYQATEITQHFDPENTSVVFAVSEKDADRFSFAPKKDGTAGYMQPFPGPKKRLKPLNKHGYVLLTPTVKFKVQGADANSASEIRQRYINANDNDRISIITDLYGDPDKNLKQIFDARLLATEQVSEMLRLAKTKGLTEAQITWLDKAIVMEREVLEDSNSSFIVYVNDNALAKVDTPEEAKRIAQHLLTKFPKGKIEIGKEHCTVDMIKQISENLSTFLRSNSIKQVVNEDYLDEKPHKVK